MGTVSADRGPPDLPGPGDCGGEGTDPSAGAPGGPIAATPARQGSHLNEPDVIPKAVAIRLEEGEPEGPQDVLLHCDFDDDHEWWRAWGSKKQPENTTLIGGESALGGRGRSLRVTVPRGEHMGTTFAYRFRERVGDEPEEIYFRYYLKFDPDWKNATFGGKLPGISGTYGRAGWGGRRVNGRDGWSARGLFVSARGGDSTAIGFYCYHADQRSRYGDDLIFRPRLEHGKWYCVEQYCKLNTPGRRGEPGRHDGVLRGWIDGAPAFERTDIRFRDMDTLRIEDIWVNVYHGGATQVPEADIHLELDEMVISRKPIGPLSPRLPGP